MDITQLVDSQRQYFMTHDTKNIQMRIKTIQNIKQWITQNEDKIIIALKKDLNKHATESYMAEIGLVLSEINYQLKHIKDGRKIKKYGLPWLSFMELVMKLMNLMALHLL